MFDKVDHMFHCFAASKSLESPIRLYILYMYMFLQITCKIRSGACTASVFGFT